MIRFFKLLKRFYLQGKFKIFFTVLSLFFIASSIFENYSKIIEQSFNVETFLFLLFSFIASLSSLIINSFAWKYLLESMSVDAINSGLINLYLRTNIFKYLPGGIWHFVERYRVIRTKVPNSIALLSMVLEPLLMVVSALFFISFGDFSVIIKLLLMLSPLTLLPKVGSKVFLRLANQFQSTLKKNKIMDKSIDLNQEQYLFANHFPFNALLLEMLFLFVRFLGFWLCLKAFLISPGLHFFDLFPLFSFAWVVGLVIPGAPAGTGVFEATLLLLLGDSISGASLISALISYRLVSTIADISPYIFFKARTTSLFSWL